MVLAELFQDSCFNSKGGGGNGINIFQSILPSLGLLKHFPETRIGRKIKAPRRNTNQKLACCQDQPRPINTTRREDLITPPAERYIRFSMYFHFNANVKLHRQDLHRMMRNGQLQRNNTIQFRQNENLGILFSAGKKPLEVENQGFFYVE
jgi:hypothetical protein